MAWDWLRRWFSAKGASLPEAAARFAQQRAGLERSFFTLVAASGKPRGLRWKAIEWQPGVEFARERQTGRLAALVGITIAFEAIEGGDMEGLPAVGNLRQGSAVFFHHQGAWHTTGKAIFNLGPGEAIARFSSLYEHATQP